MYKAFNEEDEEVINTIDIGSGNFSNTQKKEALACANPVFGIDYKQKKGRGMKIKGIVKGGPMYIAGVRMDDILTHMDNVFVDTKIGFVDKCSEYKPGDECMIKIKRAESVLTLRVIVGASGFNQKQILAVKRMSSIMVGGSLLPQEVKVEKAKKKTWKNEKNSRGKISSNST